MERKESLGSIEFLDVIVEDAQKTAETVLKEAEAAAEVKRKSAREEMAKIDAFFAEKTESEKRRIEKSSRNNIEMENRRSRVCMRFLCTVWPPIRWEA